MKLTTLRPGLSTLPPRLAPIEHVRSHAQPWRRWYKTSRWAKKPSKNSPSYGLRWSVFVRDLFTCQTCHRLEGNTSLLVAHHKIRHDGVERLFWDEANLECVCKDCHDTVKHSEESRARNGMS